MSLVRRRTWIAFVSILTLVTVAVLTTALPGRRRALETPQQAMPAQSAARLETPPQAMPAQSAARLETPPQAMPAQSAARLETPPPAEDPNVLVYIASTPPGAAIVRVSDKSVLGYTPETIQLRRSATPLRIRLELEGFAPDTREVPTASDSQLTVALKAKSKTPRPRNGT